jgi:stage IV sporulation protein B
MKKLTCLLLLAFTINTAAVAAPPAAQTAWPDELVPMGQTAGVRLVAGDRSVSGIGTLTFFDPQSKVFGALGHGINDTGTRSLMSMGTGSLLDAEVVDVRKGSSGHPGELKGSFDTDSSGTLLVNSANGLFGILDSPEKFGTVGVIPVASRDEVTIGTAKMLSNVQGDLVEQFDIEITRILDGDSQRSFMIRVVDQSLIDKTGGIVQGMSGSPIIQNGKLIGAVTHVLVNDPKKGYGIFIDNMLKEIFGS